MTRLLKWIRVSLKVILSFVIIAVALVLLVSFFIKTPGEHLTPAGIPQTTAHYVISPDGTKIAVDVSLPPSLQLNQRIPALLNVTRYTRSLELGILGRIYSAFSSGGSRLDDFNGAGYAVVTVDARGTGASSGFRYMEPTAEAVTDMAAVVDWVVSQPWSNNRVGAYGTSYSGTTAELLVATQHPAVRAVAPLYADFNAYLDTARPGGVGMISFIDEWGQLVDGLETNDLCSAYDLQGFDCFFMHLFVTGIKPVDSDSDGEQLAQILTERNNVNARDALPKMQYLDSEFEGNTTAELFPYGFQQQITELGVPMIVWAGWLDAATVSGALARYNGFSNPQELTLTPWSHGGVFHVDPFLESDLPAEKTDIEQTRQLSTFFDRHLKEGGEPIISKQVTYYTLGEGIWKSSVQWPPEGFETQQWYFAADGELLTARPSTEQGVDHYKVDFSAGTGDTARWMGGMGRDIRYADRAEEDLKLQTYTSGAFAQDIEITGTVTVNLLVASTHSEGAFHVYLEDVAPDGQVTYITEGVLRASDRKSAPEGWLYAEVGFNHSFMTADSMPMVPGKVEAIEIGMVPTSVLIRAAHRIRIAIGGHDASQFERIPAEGNPELSIYRNAVQASFVEFPVRARPGKSDRAN